MGRYGQQGVCNPPELVRPVPSTATVRVPAAGRREASYSLTVVRHAALPTERLIHRLQ